MFEIRAAGEGIAPEPYTRAQAKVERWGSKAARLSVAALVVAAVVLLAAAGFAYAKSGHWSYDATESSSASTGSVKLKYQWIDSETGEAVKDYSFTKNGRTYKSDEDGYVTFTNTENIPTTGDVPEGWESDGEKSKDSTFDKDSGTSDDSLISEDGPDFELSTDYIFKLLQKVVWSFCRNVSDWLLGLAEWALTVTGATSADIFTQDYATGSQHTFYAAASSVASVAVKPYAVAVLVCTFVIWLAHATDMRARQRTADFGVQMLFAVALFAVALTLINHAIDFCGAIYWLCQNLVVGVDRALTAAGIDVGAGLGNGALRDAFLAEMDAVTYKNWAVSIVIAFAALVALLASFNCMIYVLGAAFIRVGKIYIEACLSPLALSTIVDDRTRRVGINYLKGFAATCFQAVAIFIALGIAPAVFSIASTFVGQLVTGGLDGIQGTLQSLIPTLLAIQAVTAIVRASEPLSNRLFGTMGG